ncbi:hypothetical protein AA983_14000 [Dermacoccus sp. PE3]|nr:hypothetical protein AA983_14000 [Dermacoccus sp. PE3]
MRHECVQIVFNAARAHEHVMPTRATTRRADHVPHLVIPAPGGEVLRDGLTHDALDVHVEHRKTGP